MTRPPQTSEVGAKNVNKQLALSIIPGHELLPGDLINLKVSSWHPQRILNDLTVLRGHTTRQIRRKRR